MVKKILIIFILILTFILISIKLENNNKEIKFLENLELDYSLYNLKDNVTSIDMQGIYDNDLYLSLIDFTYNNITAITKYLIVYNFSEKKAKLIEPNLNKRITNYIINKNKIYYTSIYFENEVLKWDLSVTEDRFLNNKTLKTGTIENAVNYPVFFENNSDIYLLSIDDSQQKQSVFKLDSNEFVEVFSLDSNLENIFDLEKVKIIDDNIYYISVDNNGRKLKKFDMTNGSTKILYESTSNLETIFEFEVLPNSIVINLIKDNKSTIICLKLDKLINEYHYDYFISYMEVLDNDLIIMIDKKNNSLIYNTLSNKLETKNRLSKNIHFKFKVKDKNTIVFQDNNSRLYLYSYGI